MYRVTLIARSWPISVVLCKGSKVPLRAKFQTTKPPVGWLCYVTGKLLWAHQISASHRPAPLKQVTGFAIENAVQVAFPPDNAQSPTREPSRCHIPCEYDRPQWAVSSLFAIHMTLSHR